MCLIRARVHDAHPLVCAARARRAPHAQGDTEKRLGLPVSFGCDRDAFDLPSSQLGFYNFMVQPLYEAMALLAPMQQQLDDLDAMKAHWQAQKETRAQ